MKFLGNILIYIGLYAIWQVTLGSRHGTDSRYMLMGFAIGIPLLICGYALTEFGKNGEQRVDDEEAAKLMDEGLRTWPTFFLYLRPFDSTNEFKVPENPAQNLFSTDMWERDGYDDIERVLGKTLKPTGKFVAFGRPGEHRGAGRILIPDENWKESVERLMHRATLIFVLPSDNAGTVAELGMIKDLRLLNKSIFIMPSTTGNFRADGGSWAQRWDHMRLTCARFGLRMPLFNERGLLFMVDEQSHLNEQPLPDENPVKWANAIEKLLQDDEATTMAIDQERSGPP